MSLYTEDQQEAVYIREQAKLWLRSGLISAEQAEHIFRNADPRLKQTNMFFRLIFFLFTYLGVAAVMGLLFLVFGTLNQTGLGIALICLAVLAYGLAENCVKRHSLYRYGIEEALSLIAMAMFCSGTAMVFSQSGTAGKQMIVSLTAAACSFAVYYRLGFPYAAIIGTGALCFFVVAALPSLTPDMLRLVMALVLSSCLVFCFLAEKILEKDFQRDRNEIIQAIIWAAVYFTINLQTGDVFEYAMSGSSAAAHDINYGRTLPFVYWASYALTYLIPAAMLYLGIKQRKRFILDTALILFVVTLMTNKSYLGMERYVWDPALLGIAMIGVSYFTSRWLSKGRDGMRSGFTNRNILKPETYGIDLASLGAAIIPATIDAAPAKSEDEPFAGGSSGGGGADAAF
ncbi:MAG: hypothetical protein ABFD62_06570 [Syntrophaceae bacterium]